MTMTPDSQRLCGASEVHHRLLLTHPEYAAFRSASENRARVYASGRIATRTGITTIQVVVHVVHNPAQPEENISEAQIRSQIDVLNQDYRSQNPDVASTPAAFRPLISDARVEFRLAATDPSGNATNGITRTPTTATSFNTDDRVKSAATGGADPWPSDRYLNLWVTVLEGGLLGYAQFPGGPVETDGVVIAHTAFGSTGTALAPFNLGRTGTHEIGHWLNLHHIWGDDGTGCNGSDFVDDTPNQAGPNTGRPVFPHLSCENGPNGDLFTNYMDYVDDAAMVMFTAGQVIRMQASLSGDRSGIGLSQPRWRSTELTTLTGAPIAAGDPTAYMFEAQSTQHVHYRSGNGHVYELWWDGTGGWHATDLSAVTGAPVAVADTTGFAFEAQGTQHVVYRSNDGHIQELRWDGGTGWHAGDLVALTGAPVSVGEPKGYVCNVRGTEHVVYRSNDGHVRELRWAAASGWQAADLMTLTVAPVAVGNPMGYVFEAQGTQHVVYRSSDDHIYELWWDATSGWHSSDLTTRTGAHVAAGDPMGYVFEAQGTQHVVYRSSDDHICELWWDASSGWHVSDLTANTVAQAAAGDPAGYVFNARGSQHLIYRADDDHIHELRWEASGGWRTADLMTGTAAPAAADDPVGYVFDAQGTQHVFYRANTGHIQELVWIS